MTDKQINAVIAEACGWKGCLECNDPICEDNFIPYYTHDLNAMAQAEHSLAARQFEGYLMELLDVIHEPMLATARQRAEAFLRALGKWEEAK
jgi:hypothetical protein